MTVSTDYALIDSVKQGDYTPVSKQVEANQAKILRLKNGDLANLSREKSDGIFFGTGLAALLTHGFKRVYLLRICIGKGKLSVSSVDLFVIFVLKS